MKPKHLDSWVIRNKGKELFAERLNFVLVI